jgi:4-hydroxyphenylacetate 3-monooxygenase
MTRTGKEYIESLNDARTVYLNGEKITKVSEHPAFAEAAKSIARLYDISGDPNNRELMTFPSPKDGRPVNWCYAIPRTKEDLVRRRKAIKCWADATLGLLGRSPDHVAGFLSGFAGGADFFGRGGQQFAENVKRFHAKARDEDLHLAYAILHPTIDRSKPAHQQPEPNLYASVVKERDDGMVVRGAQMLATSAVLSNYIFVSVISPQRPGDEDYAISFVVPNNAPSLKIYPRRSYSVGVTSVFDYPLSSRLDETDSLIVFDDVFIPWEDVFVYRNIDLTFGQFNQTSAHVLGNTQAQIRFWAKIQFVVGLVKRICDLNGQSSHRDTQTFLGDLAARAATAEGLMLAAEATASEDEFGVMRPNPEMIYANQTFQQATYPEVVIMIRGMMGGSVIELPSSVADFSNPEVASDINRYIRWPNAKAEERVKVLKLLWDMIGSEFGGRHLQYEMFYAAGPEVVKGRAFRAYDWAKAEKLVDQCLSAYDLDSKAVSVPQ